MLSIGKTIAVLLEIYSEYHHQVPTLRGIHDLSCRSYGALELCLQITHPNGVIPAPVIAKENVAITIDVTTFADVKYATGSGKVKVVTFGLEDGLPLYHVTTETTHTGGYGVEAAFKAKLTFFTQAEIMTNANAHRGDVITPKFFLSKER